MTKLGDDDFVLGKAYTCNMCGRYNTGSAICSCCNENVKSEKQSEKQDISEGNRMASFLKEAFCIDGNAIIYKELIIDNMPSLMFKLTDSKRGIFYITVTK